jgi:hypothetical protein
VGNKTLLPSLGALARPAPRAGDRGAALFLPLLPARPSLIILRLTPRIGRGTMQQISALLEANQGARAPGKGAHGKARKRTAR